MKSYPCLMLLFALVKNIIARCALLAAAAFTFSGCLSSNYKLAKPGDARPAVVLHLKAKPGVNGTATTSPAEATVQSVIVYQGPGSWKREAYWDEYVVSITHRGTAPLVIEAATLTDYQGTASSPGEDPWKLESQSKTWWQKAKSSQTGNLLALGAGTVGVTGTLLAAAIIADGGFLAPATAAGGALASVAAATLVAAPIYAVTVIVINSNNKAKVLAEFERRRLPLPLTLAPGATVNGSLFFRLSPAPTRLTLRGHTDGNPCDLVVDLTPLSGLHLKPATTVPAAPTPPSSPL